MFDFSPLSFCDFLLGESSLIFYELRLWCAVKFFLNPPVVDFNGIFRDSLRMLCRRLTFWKKEEKKTFMKILLWDLSGKWVRFSFLIVVDILWFFFNIPGLAVNDLSSFFCWKWWLVAAFRSPLMNLWGALYFIWQFLFLLFLFFFLFWIFIAVEMDRFDWVPWGERPRGHLHSNAVNPPDWMAQSNI